MNYLLGVDIGTLGTKVVLVDEIGTVIAHVSREHNVYRPHPGWAEHDPILDWWQDFVFLIRQILTLSGVDATKIAAIGVVGAFPSSCITTTEGIPLRRAILYSDNRAQSILSELSYEWGIELTGDDVTPRLLWLKRNEPNLLSKAGMILNVNSFIVHRLTSVYSIDFTNATWFGGLFDYATGTWNAERCAQIGIKVSLLPPIFPCDSIVGEVTSAAALETGLKEGTPVIAGSGDMYIALLGSGAVSPGDAIVYYGTAGLLLLSIRPFKEVIGRPFLKERQELASLIAYIQATGETVRWFRNLLGEELREQANQLGISEYALLDNMSESVPAGSEGVLVLPHFLGERSPGYHPQARGCIYGLTPDHNKAILHRAILESFGFGIRHALIDHPYGRAAIHRVFACGGGACSPIWRQIVSDILGVQQTYIPKASSALGAAYLAGLGIGRFSDYEEISQVWLQDHQETVPAKDSQTLYNEYFENYLALYQATVGMAGRSPVENISRQGHAILDEIQP